MEAAIKMLLSGFPVFQIRRSKLGVLKSAGPSLVVAVAGGEVRDGMEPGVQLLSEYVYLSLGSFQCPPSYRRH